MRKSTLIAVKRRQGKKAGKPSERANYDEDENGPSCELIDEASSGQYPSFAHLKLPTGGFNRWKGYDNPPSRGAGLFSGERALYKASRAANPRNLPSIGSPLAILVRTKRIPGMAVAVSVVVPVKDEAENVVTLAREIASAVAHEAAEIIFVDDGSMDGTAAKLAALKPEIPPLRIVQHAANMGQSRAVRTGVHASKGDIVVTIDGDGQNDPADIPKLLGALRGGPSAGKVALAAGVRSDRKDPSNRRVASGLANRFRRRLLRDGATDSGCGLKAFRREAYLALPYFDHMHRFLIALMLREGYEVRHVPVNHRPRAHGQSKYSNLQRALVGVIDTFGVRWLQTRFRGPVESKEL